MKTDLLPSMLAETPPSRRGRRPKNGAGQPELSRDAVIACAVQLAQQVPLDEISMVRLARELGVAPGLIHYYVGSRDDLLSAVMNHAFRERMEALPPLTGQWREDLAAVAAVSQRMHQRWPGLAAYITTHNRFRLFQKVGEGEIDHGLAFFDHVGRILKGAGFTGEQAALAYHLVMLFLVSIGSASAHRQSPKDHADFIVGYVSKHDESAQPGASFLVRPFVQIDTDMTYRTGLDLLLDGLAGWLANGEPRAMTDGGAGHFAAAELSPQTGMQTSAPSGTQSGTPRRRRSPRA